MRSTELRNAKAELRRWFASQPTDYLTRVVDECREGVFEFWNSCHCIRGLCDGGYHSNNSSDHLLAERALAALAGIAMAAPARVWAANEQFFEDRGRIMDADNLHIRARTLPIVLAEIRRRNRIRVPAAVEVLR